LTVALLMALLFIAVALYNIFGPQPDEAVAGLAIGASFLAEVHHGRG
jgi:hypothetical protein